MSIINLKSGGYKGGDKSTPSPKLTPQPKIYINEIIPSIKKAYKNNDLKDIDLTFLVANIQCIKLNIDYSGGIKSTKLTNQIIKKIKEDYSDNRLNYSNLKFLIENINNILIKVSQNEVIIPKSGKSESKLTTLIKGYKK
tara:strand:- start:785 stop:1204 length:420 start_codon:yes stop_codon:yes gene_type:complete